MTALRYRRWMTTGLLMVCGLLWAGVGWADTQAAPDPEPGIAPNVFTRPSHPGLALLDVTAAGAAFGLLDVGLFHHLDHTTSPDTSGIWRIGRTPTFPAEMILLTGGAAVWEGGQTRLGRTLWQSLDAVALAGTSTLALKYAFGRQRPSQTSNPNLWFSGPHAQSYPSGDVSAVTSLVTPLILEYHGDHPGVDALALIPVFDMAARVRAQGHWPSDTVGGALVGFLAGYYAHQFPQPVILSVLPGGFEVGLRQRF